MYRVYLVPKRLFHNMHVAGLGRGSAGLRRLGAGPATHEKGVHDHGQQEPAPVRKGVVGVPPALDGKNVLVDFRADCE